MRFGTSGTYMVAIIVDEETVRTTAQVSVTTWISILLEHLLV